MVLSETLILWMRCNLGKIIKIYHFLSIDMEDMYPFTDAYTQEASYSMMMWWAICHEDHSITENIHAPVV